MPHYFVINLERSTERLRNFASHPFLTADAFTRIDAVDGRAIAEDHYEDYDIERFIAKNGRHPRPGEYGCYRSHIKAIKTFVESSHQTAVICEDDAKLTQEGMDFCASLDNTAAENGLLVRLTTHRKALYEPLTQAQLGFKIGQCWFGPTGSAAAYWLNKAAAQKLLEQIRIGDVPFDIALEASWHHGVPSFITRPNVFPRPTPPSSDINYDADPRYKKRPFFKRMPVLVFRAAEIVRRILNNIKTRKVPR